VKENHLSIVSVKLVREASVPYAFTGQVNAPEHAVDLFRVFLEDEDREHFVALFLSTKNRPTAISTLGIGTLSQTMVHPREVFKAAILSNSAAVIMCHNHPSGDPTPSADDVALTKRLARAGEIIGINVVDHVIVGDGSYVSMKACGLF
jgi:DNA repair protein RadC